MSRAARPAPLRVAARVLPRRVRGRARAQVPFAFEEHATTRARRCTSTARSSAASSRSRRRRFGAFPTRGRDRRPAARARRRNLRAGALGALRDERRRALPLDPPADADVDRRARGGFDWHDEAFDARTPISSRRCSAPRARTSRSRPVVGLSAGSDADLGGGITLRPAVTGEISQLWPEAHGLMPPRVRSRLDRCSCSSAPRARTRRVGSAGCGGRARRRGHRARLATAGAIAAGPVVFERLDFRPLRVAPLLPIAATEPRGEPARLDKIRARSSPPTCASGYARRRRRELAEALDRWELSLFSDEPFRSGQLREASRACSAPTAAPGPRRCAPRSCSPRRRSERSDLVAGLRAERLDRDANDAVRRALVEVLVHGARAELVEALDETLTGLRPRPSRSPRRVSRRLFVAHSSQSWNRHVTSPPATVDAWTRRTRCFGAFERIERLRGGRRRAGDPREPGARSGGRSVGACRGRREGARGGGENSRGGGRNE